MKSTYLVYPPVSVETLAFCLQDSTAEIQPDGDRLRVVAFADEAFLVSAERNMTSSGIEWVPG